MAESMLDVAFKVLTEKKASMSFFDLINEVSKRLGFSEDEKKSKMSQFYTNLSIDGRFVVLADNCWDLRDRVPFEQVHIDMNEAYNDKVDDDEEEEGDEEESDGDEKLKELGEDVDENATDDAYEEDDDASEDEKAEKAKKELGA
ncbi:MAG: DNA-directed RNA polymerase subunit delta [Bacilli bacterium]|jgi:DNA-directed RNA polymerase subunit delta|nr:DNA-directed RNA polymerase subunit delta [Bacilli bacterium]